MGQTKSSTRLNDFKSMKATRLVFFALAVVFSASASGCDDILGSKSDETTDEIFREGRIDPSLLEDVGYVPLTPFFTTGFTGPLQRPTDVYVGYDDFIYVVDDAGLNVLDLAGRPVAFIAADRATAVVQKAVIGRSSEGRCRAR